MTDPVDTEETPEEEKDDGFDFEDDSPAPMIDDDAVLELEFQSYKFRRMDLSCVKSKNLMEAVQKNRQEEILTRMWLGEKVDAVFTMGRTALHCAAANSNMEAVSTLLLYSPNLKVRSPHAQHLSYPLLSPDL